MMNRLGILVLATTFLVGCGGSGSNVKHPDRTKVSGVVTLKGTPVEGATVTLHPVSKGNGAFGITDAICAATHRTRNDLKHGRQGQSGARPKGDIGVHALRMGDVVGDHTVYYVGNGERIQLSHVAHSREIFVKGALRAAAFIGKQKPGRYTMDHVLGL